MTRESIEATLFVGFFAILVTVFFTFALSKLADYAIDRNIKVLNYLLDIRETVENNSTDAKRIDQMIEFRRAKFIEKQEKSYLRSRNDSDIDDLNKLLKKKKKIQRKHNFVWNTNFTMGIFVILVSVAVCWILALLGSSIAISQIFH